jgi:hypothetical protein
MDQLKNTADFNVDNIDEMLVDLRATTENLKQLTDTVKTRPSTLLLGNKVNDRQPGDNQR